MGVGRFKAGERIRIHKDEYVLIRRITDTCWQLEQLSTKRIKELEQPELTRMYAVGTLTFCASSQLQSIGQSQFEEAVAEADEIRIRRMYAKVFLAEMTRAAKIAAIDKLSKQLQITRPPSHTTVYRWSRRYSDAGNDARVLAKQHHSKGNRSSRYDQEVVEFCNSAIDEVYLRRERGSAADAHQAAVARIIRENKLRPPECALPKPSPNLIRQLIKKIPAFDRHVARHGHDAAVRHFRWVKGHVVAERPLARVEIDHTHLDLFVVDEKERLPLGRPYLTLAIDVYTRCILGAAIEFFPPSYLSVCKALQHSFMPKPLLRTEYPEIANEWMPHGVMNELVVDNGPEFHSSSLEAIGQALDVTIVYAPRRQAWFKPHVERMIRSVNSEIPQKTPGTSFSNVFEKEDYNPVSQAVVRFSILKRAIFRWITDVYHQRPHRALGTTPAQMWANSISEEDIPLPDESANLDLIMGRQYSRTLTHRGIDFACLQYNSIELADLRRRLGARLDVAIRVNEENLGYIFVLDPRGDNAYKVPALRRDYADNLTLFQHDVFRKYQRARLDELDEVSGWIEAKREIMEMITQDTATTRHRAKTRQRQARLQSQATKPAGVQPFDEPQLSDDFVEYIPEGDDTAEAEVTSLRFPPIIRPRHVQ